MHLSMWALSRVQTMAGLAPGSRPDPHLIFSCICHSAIHLLFFKFHFQHQIYRAYTGSHINKSADDGRLTSWPKAWSTTAPKMRLAFGSTRSYMISAASLTCKIHKFYLWYLQRKEGQHDSIGAPEKATDKMRLIFGSTSSCMSSAASLTCGAVSIFCTGPWFAQTGSMGTKFFCASFDRLCLAALYSKPVSRECTPKMHHEHWSEKQAASEILGGKQFDIGSSFTITPRGGRDLLGDVACSAFNAHIQYFCSKLLAFWLQGGSTYQTVTTALC